MCEVPRGVLSATVADKDGRPPHLCVPVTTRAHCTKCSFECTEVNNHATTTRRMMLQRRIARAIALGSATPVAAAASAASTAASSATCQSATCQSITAHRLAARDLSRPSRPGVRFFSAQAAQVAQQQIRLADDAHFVHLSAAASLQRQPEPQWKLERAAPLPEPLAQPHYVPDAPLPPADLPEINDGIIEKFASKPVRSVCLQEIIDMGSSPAYLLTAAQWLWEELPVRLAKRLRDLDSLPFGLTKTAEVQSLMALYRISLAECLACERPTSSATELLFTDMLKRALVRHEATSVDLATGANLALLAQQQQQAEGGTGGDANGTTPPSLLQQHFILQDFLDRFNAARISSRLLMSQHVALHNPPREGFVGVIQLDVDPEQIVRQAAADAAAVMRATLGVAPQVRITDMSKKLVKIGAQQVRKPNRADGAGIKGFHYVPAHLRAMLFELLKNAFQATVTHARHRQAERTVPGTEGIEQDPPLPPEGSMQLTDESVERRPVRSSLADGDDADVSRSSAERRLHLPPVEVVIVDGESDVTIKVSDHGGGIARSDLPRVFDYTFSTTQHSSAQQHAQAEAAERQRQLAQKALEAAQAESDATGDTLSAACVTPASVSAVAQTLEQQQGDCSFLTGSGCEPSINTAVNDFSEAFGLPVTRLYARVLGGDLQLKSLAGHGTDAFLFLSKPHTKFANVQE